MYSPEVNARLNALRAKAADGTITQVELSEGVALLRQGRRSSVEAASKRRTSAAKATRNADDLLNELEGLA